MTAIGEARALARTAGAAVRCPRGSMSLTDRLLRRDPETRALCALARGVERLPERRRPEESLQLVADLARRLTRAKYSALAVTDEHDRTQGFVTSGLSKDDLRGLRTPPQAHGPLSSLRRGRTAGAL